MVDGPTAAARPAATPGAITKKEVEKMILQHTASTLLHGLLKSSSLVVAAERETKEALDRLLSE